jgi:hypothetical protein
MKTIEHLM